MFLNNIKPIKIIFIIICIILISGCSDREINTIQSNKRNSNTDQVEIITDYINIRSEKSVESDILGKVHKGEIYSILSTDDSSYKWIEINTENNIHGYISGKDEYISILYSDNKDNSEETNIDNNEDSQNNQKYISDNKKKSSDNKSNQSSDNVNKNTKNESNTTILENASNVISINIDNWNQYFEIKEWVDWQLNAFNEPTNFFGIRISFNIKNKYKNCSSNNIAMEYLINQSYNDITYDVKNKKYFVGPAKEYFDEHTSTLSGGSYESYLAFSLGDGGTDTGSYQMSKYNFVKVTRIQGTLTCNN